MNEKMRMKYGIMASDKFEIYLQRLAGTSTWRANDAFHLPGQATLEECRHVSRQRPPLPLRSPHSHWRPHLPWPLRHPLVPLASRRPSRRSSPAGPPMNRPPANGPASALKEMNWTWTRRIKVKHHATECVSRPALIPRSPPTFGELLGLKRQHLKPEGVAE